MKEKAAALLFAALFVFAQPPIVQAQTYVSLVYGGLPCTVWAGRKQIEGRVYEAWIFGYVSSYNAYVFKGPNVIDGVEIADVRDWIDAYCKRNPGDSLDTVARALVDEYAKKTAQ
jgi:hypothetical protein